MIKVRKSDWRDRQQIQALRRLIYPIDGGLFELLHWPIYHVHHALDDSQVIGFTSVCLDGRGSADDTGTIVTTDPAVYSILRRVQIRDLAIMGVNDISVTATLDQRPYVEPYWGAPLGQLDREHLFYHAPVDLVQTRMQQAGVQDPLPLMSRHIEELQHKAAQAHAFIKQLNALSYMTQLKANLLKGH